MKGFADRLQGINWKKIDHLAPIVLVLLILYLCWKLANFFWLIVAPPQVMQFDRVELGSQQKQIPNITSFALFQEVSTSPADANLNFVLQGVVVGNPSQFSSAVIKLNEVAERYRVGDVIESTSYQLAEVYWNKVKLRHSNGSMREITFTGIENGLDQPIVPPSANVNGQAPQSAPPQTELAINNAMQKIQQDKDQYLKDMGVSSSISGGYEVTENTPAALKNGLGLQAGDKVITINGKIVGPGQSDVELLAQVKREGKVKLEIKRGDQVMTIQQDFR